MVAYFSVSFLLGFWFYDCGLGVVTPPLAAKTAYPPLIYYRFMIIAFFEIVQIVLVDSIKDRPTAAPREC